jgi:hypothetical protein
MSFAVPWFIVSVDRIVQPQDTVPEFMHELQCRIKGCDCLGGPAQFGKVSKIEPEIPNNVLDPGFVLIILHGLDLDESYSGGVVAILQPE